RVWIFGAERVLGERESELLLARVDAFLDAWKAHGTPLTAARAWRDGSFLVVAVDERTAPPSGCSIDAMVRLLGEVEAVLGVALVDSHAVWYRDEAGEVKKVDRSAFRALAESGVVSPATPVFDRTLTRLEAWRRGDFERP